MMLHIYTPVVIKLVMCLSTVVTVLVLLVRILVLVLNSNSTTNINNRLNFMHSNRSGNRKLYFAYSEFAAGLL